MEDGVIIVNNFFTYWIKEINITKYGTNKNLIPTATLMEIYQYSDSMLRHLPEKTLKNRNDFFAAKRKLSLTTRISIEGLTAAIHLLR